MIPVVQVILTTRDSRRRGEWRRIAMRKTKPRLSQIWCFKRLSQVTRLKSVRWSSIWTSWNRQSYKNKRQNPLKALTEQMTPSCLVIKWRLLVALQLSRLCKKHQLLSREATRAMIIILPKFIPFALLRKSLTASREAITQSGSAAHSDWVRTPSENWTMPIWIF